MENSTSKSEGPNKEEPVADDSLPPRARHKSLLLRVAEHPLAFYISFASCLIYGGIATGLVPASADTKSIAWTAFAVLAVAVIFVHSVQLQFDKRKLSDFLDDGDKFVDVDKRRLNTQIDRQVEEVRELIRDLQNRADKAAVPDTSDAFAAIRSRLETASTPTLPASQFVQYFDSIRKLLEEKASDADTKASILLDKGTAYSRFGIGFMIFSIIGWQGVAYVGGFTEQLRWGIASTAFLFVFIEFLSAWFLRQYRQFVDTSTYLIKVKSIFDRYMLIYHAGEEAIAKGHESKKPTQLLLEVLKSDISWPDSYLMKNPDISFAKEALETMSLMAKTLKSEAVHSEGDDAGAVKPPRTRKPAVRKPVAS